jgi:hypothetical protein
MNCGVRSCEVRSYRPIRIITESLSTSNRPEISVKSLQLFIMASAILSQVFDIIWEWSLQTQGGPWTIGICSIRVCTLTKGIENINLIHVSSQNQTCVGEHIPYSPRLQTMFVQAFSVCHSSDIDDMLYFHFCLPLFHWTLQLQLIKHVFICRLQAVEDLLQCK